MLSPHRKTKEIEGMPRSEVYKMFKSAASLQNLNTKSCFPTIFIFQERKKLEKRNFTFSYTDSDLKIEKTMEMPPFFL